LHDTGPFMQTTGNARNLSYTPTFQSTPPQDFATKSDLKTVAPPGGRFALKKDHTERRGQVRVRRKHESPARMASHECRGRPAEIEPMADDTVPQKEPGSQRGAAGLELDL
jgi:hypothetical protein